MRTPLARLALLLVLSACAPAADQSESDTAAVVEEQPGVMSVTARGLSFSGPAEVPAGWTTLRLTNDSDVVHFVIVERLPQGQSLASQQEQIAPVFQDGMNLLAQGDGDAALVAFGELPPWFGEIVFLGGPGLTAPGRTSQATVFLEPGTYLLECYVKTGLIFHSFNPDPSMTGMVHQFTVTADTSDVAEPEADLEIDISSADGIVVHGTPATGEQTIAVHYVDQTAHENFVGHDVHLVRLAPDTEVEELEAWMNWTSPTGLTTPAPGEFLGGLNEMPAGSAGYFTVTLTPGRYAWVAEVPGTIGKGMLREFYLQ